MTTTTYQAPTGNHVPASVCGKNYRQYPNMRIAVCDRGDRFISPDGKIRDITDRNKYGDKVFLQRRLKTDKKAPDGFSFVYISRKEAFDILKFTNQYIKVFVVKKYNTIGKWTAVAVGMSGAGALSQNQAIRICDELNDKKIRDNDKIWEYSIDIV